MRAVVCRHEGPVEDLELADWDDPVVGAGQVLVAVEAAGVNYVDALFVRGEYQIRPRTPFVPGSEVAGVVLEIGDGVDTVSVGDRVVANCGMSGYAECVVAPALGVSRLPDALDAPRAAAFVQSYCTARFALDRRASLQPGETVLVLGASGGVGRAAVDVAKAMGARVVAVASNPERVAVARAAGADEVVDHSCEDLKAAVKALVPNGVDVVVDPVGDRFSEPALRTMGVDGRFLVIGFAAGEIARIPLNLVLLRNRRIVGVDWGAWMLTHPVEQAALTEELLEMVAAGRLHPPMPVTYPLANAAEALADLLANRVGGKAVLLPGGG